jgi:hypothetical protein
MKKHPNGQLGVAKASAAARLPPPPSFGRQVGATSWREKTARREENGQLSPEPSSRQKSGCIQAWHQFDQDFDKFKEIRRFEPKMQSFSTQHLEISSLQITFSNQSQSSTIVAIKTDSHRDRFGLSKALSGGRLGT